MVCCACCGTAPAGTASDGGSGTYTPSGRTYTFVLFNGGTTTWQYFYLVGPSGTSFVGGGTVSEASPRCAVGQPDGGAEEIECGPLPASLAPPNVHFAVVATLAAPVACGAPFQLYVSSTGVPPFTRAADVPDTESCPRVPPHAVRRPTIRGTPVVGHTLGATPAVWSAPPTHASYRWQRCTTKSCTWIRGATRLTLTLDRSDLGRSVRIVATATVDDVTVTSRSARVAVRAKR